MKVLLTLVTVGALAAAIATAAPASAAYPGSNGRIAFSSRESGNPEIYTVRPDGTGLRQLTRNGAAFNDTPSYSPDGRYLAFSSSATGELQIYVMRSDGTELRQVPTGLAFSYNPTWSPDGQRLAFSGATEDDSPRDLYVIGVDGHGLRQLTNDFADVGVDGISWRPTGGLIAFDSDVTNFMQVYTIRPDGTQRTRLTNGHAYNDQPDFSPDGRSLAYVHTSFHAAGATSGINTIDVATRQITHLTDSATMSDESPAWSPDARQIVFTRPTTTGSTDLERVTLSTGVVTAVTATPWYEYDPSWQPR